MAYYTYTASKKGKTVTGTIEASSKENAQATLSHQGIHPLIVKEVSASGGLASILKRRSKKVKIKDLVVFTRQLSTMVSAGVPLTRSLVTLESQTNNKYFGTVIAGVMKEVEGGIALADALEKYPNVFSEVYINMVRAGEAGGILDDILKRLASQVEKDATIRKKIKSAMAYPTVILSITVLAFFGIMFFIMPKLGKILKDLRGPDAQLPVYTQVLLGISDFSRKNAIFIFIVGFVPIYFFRR